MKVHKWRGFLRTEKHSWSSIIFREYDYIYIFGWNLLKHNFKLIGPWPLANPSTNFHLYKILRHPGDRQTDRETNKHPDKHRRKQSLLAEVKINIVSIFGRSVRKHNCPRFHKPTNHGLGQFLRSRANIQFPVRTSQLINNMYVGKIFHPWPKQVFPSSKTFPWLQKALDILTNLPSRLICESWTHLSVVGNPDEDMDLPGLKQQNVWRY